MLFLNVDEARVSEYLRQSLGNVELPVILSCERPLVYEIVQALDGMVKGLSAVLVNQR